MNDMLEFAPDQGKSDRCLRERGFSFDFLIPAFTDPGRRVEIDDRRDYGEIRYRPYRRIGARWFVVVYTPRGAIRWIISARKANARERRRHGDQGPPQGRCNGG